MRRQGWCSSRRPCRNDAPTSRIRTRSSRRSPSVHSLRRSWSPAVVSSHRPSITPSARINWSTLPSWSRKRSMTSSTFHRYCYLDYHDDGSFKECYSTSLRVWWLISTLVSQSKCFTFVAAEQNSCNNFLNLWTWKHWQGLYRSWKSWISWKNPGI